MTYLDHQIFLAIRSECVYFYLSHFLKFFLFLIKTKLNFKIENFYREFLGQAWMKSDKKFRAEHIIQMTKRFNDGSRLVGSEIVSR